MQRTENYRLFKPESTDNGSPEPFNNNADVIDAELNRLSTGLSRVDDALVAAQGVLESGITAAKVSKLDALPTSTQLDGNLSAKANKTDITNISITGTTNNTGSTILAGTLFYLNGALCKAIDNIPNGAPISYGSNYVSMNLRHGKYEIYHTIILNPTSSTDFVNAFEYTIPANCLYSISAIQNYTDGGRPTGVRILAHEVGVGYAGVYAENRDAASFCGRTTTDTVFIVQFKSTTPNAVQTGSFAGWFEYTD